MAISFPIVLSLSPVQPMQMTLLLTTRFIRKKERLQFTLDLFVRHELQPSLRMIPLRNCTTRYTLKYQS